MVEEADPGEWQRRYDESLAREQAQHDDDAKGCLAQLTDLRIWAAAILIPFGLAAGGLSWVAEQLGWSHWIGLSVACVVAIAIAGLLVVKQLRNR